MNYKFHFIDFHKNKIEGFDLHIDILISTHRQTNQNTRKIYIYITKEIPLTSTSITIHRSNSEHVNAIN